MSLSLNEIHEIGKELENLYALRTAPLAIKLVNRDEIPEKCVQPSSSGKHYALCQALSFVRRTRNHLVTFIEDNWCLWPVINFRQGPITPEDEKRVGSGYFIRDPEVSYRHFHEEFPYIDEDKAKEGIAIAPLESCTFVPDAIMLYCKAGQLRQFLMASKWHSGNITGSSFDTCDSCGAALVPVLNGTMDYNVSIPDAGEYERSLCDEDELMYTLSIERLGDFIESARDLHKKGFGYKQLTYDIRNDYARPTFYQDMFEKWGHTDRGETWVPGVR